MHKKQHSKVGLISSSLAAHEKSICRSKYEREKDLDFWWKESEFLIIANSYNTSKEQSNLKVNEIFTVMYKGSISNISAESVQKISYNYICFFYSLVHFYFYSTKIILIAARAMKDILYRHMFKCFLCKLAKILRK